MWGRGRYENDIDKMKTLLKWKRFQCDIISIVKMTYCQNDNISKVSKVLVPWQSKKISGSMWLIFLTITCRKCCHFDKQTILTIYRLLSLYIRCHSKNLCNDVNLVSCCHFDNEVILAMSFWAMSTPWCQLEDRRCRNITAFDGYPVFDVESLEPSDLGHFRRVWNFNVLSFFWKTNFTQFQEHISR